MKAVFADTSYYVAFLNANDAHHAAALRWSRRLRQPMVLTEYVLTELGSWLSVGPHRRHYPGLVRTLRGEPQTTILPASRELFDRGLDLFERRPDKEWSLTDCISFVVMRQRRIEQALTTDHHFQQAGFTILLK